MPTHHTTRPTELERTLYTRRPPCCGCAHWKNPNHVEQGYCQVHERRTWAAESCQSWQLSPQLQGEV